MKKLLIVSLLITSNITNANFDDIKAPHKRAVGGDVYWNYDIHKGSPKKSGWVSYNLHFDKWVSYTESITNPSKRNLKISISKSPACTIMLLRGENHIFRTKATSGKLGKMKGVMYKTSFGKFSNTNTFTSEDHIAHNNKLLGKIKIMCGAIGNTGIPVPD